MRGTGRGSKLSVLLTGARPRSMGPMDGSTASAKETRGRELQTDAGVVSHMYRGRRASRRKSDPLV
jgi:hypothetical protein